MPGVGWPWRIASEFVSLPAYRLLNGASGASNSTCAGVPSRRHLSLSGGGTVRHFVVLAVFVLVSVFAQAAYAADPTLVGATASPSAAAPGQQVRLTARASLVGQKNL